MSHQNGQTHPATEGQVRNARPYLGLGFGVVTCSTAALLIRLAQVDTHSLAIAAWRLAVAALILTPIVLLTRRVELRGLSRREWGSALVSGVLLAIHFATWISSLAYTSVAASTVLVSAYALFVGVASHLLLQERLSREMVVAIVVATAGSAIIGLGDLGAGTHRLWGDFLALMGALSGAGYFLIGRRLRGRLSLLAYVCPVYGTAAVVLVAILLISGLPRVPASPQTWLWILLMALGPQLLGHSSLNWALRYLTATYVTIATLAEPIASTLLAWWLLGERPPLWTVAGGALTLVGIAIASHVERPGEETGHWVEGAGA